MYDIKTEERLAGVMLLRWDTATEIGDAAGAVSEASNFIATQLTEDHPLRAAFVALGFIAESPQGVLAPLAERSRLLTLMLNYVSLLTRGLSADHKLEEAPRAFYTAALLLEEGQEELLRKIVAYKPY